MTQTASFPIELWREDMLAAIEEICAAGERLLTAHRQSSAQAEAAAEQWELGAKLTTEREALNSILGRIEGILVSTRSLEDASDDPAM